ncbi:hypothetical protein EYB53_013445, partial [Candidatus Chloroploca sp. M-50]
TAIPDPKVIDESFDETSTKFEITGDGYRRVGGNLIVDEDGEILITIGDETWKNCRIHIYGLRVNQNDDMELIVSLREQPNDGGAMRFGLVYRNNSRLSPFDNSPIPGFLRSFRGIWWNRMDSNDIILPETDDEFRTSIDSFDEIIVEVNGQEYRSVVGGQRKGFKDVNFESGAVAITIRGYVSISRIKVEVLP